MFKNLNYVIGITNRDHLVLFNCGDIMWILNKNKNWNALTFLHCYALK